MCSERSVKLKCLPNIIVMFLGLHVTEALVRQIPGLSVS